MYIDLVLCRHSENGRAFLFAAPAWTRLRVGDLVVVETRLGRAQAVVVASLTVEQGSEEFKFAVACAGANVPLKKVISKVTYINYYYAEEDDDEHLPDRQ